MGGSLLRVGTYNLYLGADLNPVLQARSADELAVARREVQRQLEATRFAQRAPAIARLLVRERLDLVGLQEVCTWHLDGELLADFQTELLEALVRAGEAYDAVVAQPTFAGSGEVAGPDGPARLALRGANLILRRRDAAVRVRSTSRGVFGAALPVHTEGETVAIARGWCTAVCEIGTGRFSFVNTHTEAYAAQWRDRQRDELVAVLPAHPEPVVVVGDFNATPDRVGMPPSFQDAWVAAGHDSSAPDGLTCCQAADLGNDVSRLHERIDYVWTRGFEVRSSRRFGGDGPDRTSEGRWPSDHAGVAAELRLAH